MAKHSKEDDHDDASADIRAAIFQVGAIVNLQQLIPQVPQVQPEPPADGGLNRRFGPLTAFLVAVTGLIAAIAVFVPGTPKTVAPGKNFDTNTPSETTPPPQPEAEVDHAEAAPTPAQPPAKATPSRVPPPEATPPTTSAPTPSSAPETAESTTTSETTTTSSPPTTTSPAPTSTTTPPPPPGLLASVGAGLASFVWGEPASPDNEER